MLPVGYALDKGSFGGKSSSSLMYRRAHMATTQDFCPDFRGICAATASKETESLKARAGDKVSVQAQLQLNIQPQQAAKPAGTPAFPLPGCSMRQGTYLRRKQAALGRLPVRRSVDATFAQKISKHSFREILTCITWYREWIPEHKDRRGISAGVQKALQNSRRECLLLCCCKADCNLLLALARQCWHLDLHLPKAALEASPALHT